MDPLAQSERHSELLLRESDGSEDLLELMSAVLAETGRFMRL